MKLLTQREVAARLNCSIEKVRGLRREKKLQFVRFGHRSVRVRESEVERLVNLYERKVQ